LLLFLVAVSLALCAAVNPAHLSPLWRYFFPAVQAVGEAWQPAAVIFSGCSQGHIPGPLLCLFGPVGLIHC